MLYKMMRSVLFIFLLFTLLALIERVETEAQQKPKWVRYLYLIRHGDYTPQDDKIADSLNVLTPLGIAQARLVAARLTAMNITFSSLVNSTLTRARETADVISKDLPGLKREHSDLIRECTPPSWRKDIMAGVDTAERSECAGNLEQAFKKYFIPSPDDKERNDIIVCHGNVIRYFVTKVLKVDTMSWLQMSITNCSLTIVRILPDGTMKLDAFSDYGHIPENMRTFTGGKNETKGLLIDGIK